MTEITLTFPPPCDPISMNQGDTWPIRQAAAAWHDRAYWAWVEQHPGVGPSGRAFPHPAEVHIVLPFPSSIRRDPINFTKTVKHIVDGIKDAGAWPDDTPNFVVQNIPTLSVGKGLPVVIRVVYIGERQVAQIPAEEKSSTT